MTPRRGQNGAIRYGAALVALGGLAVLATAAWLKPDPRGMGTHEQLGGGGCGFLLLTKLPCPTCGMTTAFAHTVRGQFFSAIWAQPAGFVLALATVAAVAFSIRTLITGRLPFVSDGWLAPFRLFTALLLLLIGGWAYKIMMVLSHRT
ncbi:MAG: DUF2752 domain-containing protein [Phycisphaerae bacterium]